MWRKLIAVVLLVAGVALAQADGGLPPSPEAEQIAQLRRELAELSVRLAEAEAQAAVNAQLLGQVDQLNQQVAAVRDELQQAQAAKVEREANVDLAIQTVIAVQQQLIFGDTTNADQNLAFAESMMPPIARTQISAARFAIENKDLGNARWYLQQAAWDAERGR